MPTAPEEHLDSPEVSLRLRRIGAGDQDARAWLYETFSPRLFRRLRARYGGMGGLDAEELLHDAFVSLFRPGRALNNFLEQVPPDEQTVARFEIFFWNHACGIASNRRRAMKRRAVVPLADVDPGSAQAGPERENLSRDTLARLAECLEKSGSRVYLYYKLRFVDGLTPGEIVDVTGWSRKATYKLKLSLNEAVERCAKRLGLQ